MRGIFLLFLLLFNLHASGQPAYQSLKAFITKGDLSSHEAQVAFFQTKQLVNAPTTSSTDKIAGLKVLCDLFDNNELGHENADSLLLYGDLLVKTARKVHDDEAEAEGLATTVVAVSYLKDPIRVLKSGLAALDVVKAKKIETRYIFQWTIINKLVYAYLFLGDYPNASRLAGESITLIRKQSPGDRTNRILSDSYLTAARMNGYFKKLPLAMSLLDSALIYSKKANNIPQSFYIKNDWASLRLDNHEPDKAIPVLNECLAYFKQKNNRFGIGEASMLLGKAWLLKNDYTRSIEYAQQAAIQPVNTRIQVGIYETLHEAFKKTGQWKNALAAHEKVILMKETVFNDKLSNEKQIFESRLAFQEQEQIKVKQEQDIEIQKNIRNSAIVVVLVLSLLAIFLILNRRIILQKNKLIHVQNERIEAMNAGLEAKVQERTMELQEAYDEIKDAMANGQSQERKRVAAELHDTLGSLLSSVNFGLEALGNMTMSERERKIFKRVVSITDDAYDEVRMLSHNYYPRELEQVGLASALSILTEKLNLYSKTVFQFKSDGTVYRFAKETENHLYAVCLELVNNIEKHAHATQAVIEIGQSNSHIQLLIRDNGKGMNVSEAQLKGAGFGNLRERIGSLSGHLAVESSTSGTVFTISAPATTIKETESNHS